MILINLVSADVFKFFRDTKTFQEAIDTLKAKYFEDHNIIFLRHSLNLCKQCTDESIRDYIAALKSLSLNCQFNAVDVSTHKKEAIRGSFIAGLKSPSIRQRLLESDKTDLDAMIELACSLELACKNTSTYEISELLTEFYEGSSQKPVICHINQPAGTNYDTSFVQAVDHFPKDFAGHVRKTNTKRNVCSFCGNGSHTRSACPAREAVYFKCNIKGHFAKVCRKSRSNNTFNKKDQPVSTCCSTTSIDSELKPSIAIIIINDMPIKALIDSGSTNNYVNPNIAKLCKLDIHKSNSTHTVAMASEKYHMPFGVTNGRAIFQPKINNSINQHCLKGVFAYMDNIHVCVHDQSDHDINLAAFTKAAKVINLTLNPTKSVLSSTKLVTLGYTSIIEKGTKKPDPERLQPLMNMPVLNTSKALQRCVGLFSYYVQRIRGFSDKVAS